MLTQTLYKFNEVFRSWHVKQTQVGMILVERMDPKTDRVIGIDLRVQSAYTMFIYAKYKSSTETSVIVLISRV
jgi:hypothetical protein